MKDVTGYFGELVFNDAAMRDKLPRETYDALKATIGLGKPLAKEMAGVVANAMKEWAIEKGATHFTHWFQPLTGVTAEKHDAFISPGKDGTAIMEFSGKELTMGEPDASSFPSGGLRPTFEARGYTAWDPTSYAFIKDGTLCIPTVFFAYSGEALDKKTPLLRSMELIDRESRRMLKLLGHGEVSRVIPMAGAEQEYFLVDKALYDRRPDLVFCRRTLFGAKPPKGQELDDHYFGVMQPRVAEFMRELDRELWRLGVFAKTEHKEAAPGQFELAPVFCDVNTATDTNQLTMELMQQIALRHGMVCLLHEKPFMRLNGSGKHNNWSLSTDTGMRILDPGKAPGENLVFIVFLTAIIKAVDEYQDLLRVSVASAGNDCRLGGMEAPPSIVSIFLGDELTELLHSIERDEDYIAAKRRVLESGTSVVPTIRTHNTDRNRTSPMAFTGNKFEFRMVGASQSIADVNTVLNTIVAEALSGFSDEIEAAEDVHRALSALLRRTLGKHSRILYNGNSYSEEWRAEAQKRGLSSLPSVVDALPRFISESNVELFTKHGIFTEREMRSRYEIELENYVKRVSIEAKTMLELTHRDILPAVIEYQRRIAAAANEKKPLGVDIGPELAKLGELSGLASRLAAEADALDKALHTVKNEENMLASGGRVKNDMLCAMAALRETADKLEVVTARELWPFPTYEKLLLSMD